MLERLQARQGQTPVFKGELPESFKKAKKKHEQNTYPTRLRNA